MKVAIYGRYFDEEYSPFIQRLFDKLAEINAEIWVFAPFDKFLRPKVDYRTEPSSFATHSDLNNNVDFLFSIGGDGTFLDASNFVQDTGTPVVGVNTGRFGFLSSIAIDEIDDAIDALQEGRYSLDSRTLLQLEMADNVFGESSYALNEITVSKQDTSSMVTIHVYLDGEFLNSYWADGLIVSTATGSTAYSLSCGGPIVIPGTGIFVITPVSPHNLNVRPVVVSDDSVIQLKIGSRTEQVLVSLDSRSEILDADVQLTVRKNSFKINLVRLEEHSYLSTLRGKLNWGLDTRN